MEFSWITHISERTKIQIETFKTVSTFLFWSEKNAKLEKYELFVRIKEEARGTK